MSPTVIPRPWSPRGPWTGELVRAVAVPDAAIAAIGGGPPRSHGPGHRARRSADGRARPGGHRSRPAPRRGPGDGQPAGADPAYLARRRSAAAAPRRDPRRDPGRDLGDRGGRSLGSIAPPLARPG